MSYKNIIERLEAYPRHLPAGLDRMRTVLESLNLLPISSFLPKTIHIVGTNGKGSTTTFLADLLSAHGKKVDHFTSPHLVDVRERIYLGNSLISLEDFESYFQQIEMSTPIQISFFEMLMSIGFLAFSKSGSDYLLLEAGLGGRLDASNVIETPEMVIIAPISYDHMNLLGNTLAQIASEKAAVIKANCVVFSARQEDDVFHVIQKKCQEVGVNLYYEGRDWQLAKNLQRKLEHLAPYQFQNFSLALASFLYCTRQDHIKVNPQKIVRVVESFKWLGRFHCLTKQAGMSLWVDGAHNEAGARELSRALLVQKRQEEEQGNDYRIGVIFNVLKTKELDQFILALTSSMKPNYWGILSDDSSLLKNHAYHMSDEIKGTLEKFQVQSAQIMQDDFAELINKFAQKKCTHILICGSLYLIGEVIKKIASSS